MLNQAQNSATRTEEETAKEDVSMAWNSVYTDYIVASTQNAGVEKASFFTAENISKYIHSGTITNVVYRYDGSVSLKYQITGKDIQYNFVVAENGNVTMEGELGTTVSLGTVTANGTNLAKGWKYFYDDGSNIYLIYEHYLENAAIPSGENIEISGYRVYGKPGPGRDTLINYLKNTTTWREIAKGVENALKAKNVTVTGVTATGGPTVEQFQQSYDTMYASEGFKVKYVTSGTETASADGYVYKVGTADWATSKDLSLGSKNNMYQLTTATTDAYGYWLARPFGYQL